MNYVHSRGDVISSNSIYSPFHSDVAFLCELIYGVSATRKYFSINDALQFNQRFIDVIITQKNFDEQM